MHHHDHWIITWFGWSSILDHHHMLSRFFSSQEVLQSQSCRPTLHVGLHQRLYLTLKSEWPAQLLCLTSSCQKGTPNTHIWPHLIRKAQHSHLTMCKHIAPEWLSTYIRSCASTSHQKGSALTSNLILSERNNTYSRPCSKAPHRKGSSLRIDHALKHCIERAQRLQSNHARSTASERALHLQSDHAWSIALERALHLQSEHAWRTASKRACAHIWSWRN